MNKYERGEQAFWWGISVFFFFAMIVTTPLIEVDSPIREIMIATASLMLFLLLFLGEKNEWREESRWRF